MRLFITSFFCALLLLGLGCDLQPFGTTGTDLTPEHIKLKEAKEAKLKQYVNRIAFGVRLNHNICRHVIPKIVVKENKGDWYVFTIRCGTAVFYYQCHDNYCMEAE